MKINVQYSVNVVRGDFYDTRKVSNIKISRSTVYVYLCTCHMSVHYIVLCRSLIDTNMEVSNLYFNGTWVYAVAARSFSAFSGSCFFFIV